MPSLSLLVIGALTVMLGNACDRNNDVSLFDRSVLQHPVQCSDLAALNNGALVADIAPVGDSAFAVVYADERQLITYDDHLRITHTLTFDKAGPRGIARAASAAVNDTALFIADEADGLIKRFDRAGQDRGIVRLNFLPRRIRFMNDKLLVAPHVAGSNPRHLLFVIEAKRPRALPIPSALYDDAIINSFANSASLAIFPDRAVVLHEMIVPFGYLLPGLDVQTSVKRFPIPLPEAIHKTLEQLPEPPITDKNVNQLTVVAFAAAPNLMTGSTYYITRVPNGQDSFQKLLVELDTMLTLRRVVPIDANLHHMVYLPATSSLIGVDGEDNWFQCRIS